MFSKRNTTMIHRSAVRHYRAILLPLLPAVAALSLWTGCTALTAPDEPSVKEVALPAQGLSFYPATPENIRALYTRRPIPANQSAGLGKAHAVVNPAAINALVIQYDEDSYSDPDLSQKMQEYSESFFREHPEGYDNSWDLLVDYFTGSPLDQVISQSALAREGDYAKGTVSIIPGMNTVYVALLDTDKNITHFASAWYHWKSPDHEDGWYVYGEKVDIIPAPENR